MSTLDTKALSDQHQKNLINVIVVYDEVKCTSLQTFNSCLFADNTNISEHTFLSASHVLICVLPPNSPVV